MTSIIAALNKKAVAVAADSAVTIGDKKVYNEGEKLFELSHYAPVGIAIYGNLELINVPIDVIIKNYANSLKNATRPTLREYVSDFFVKLKQQSYFLSEGKQKVALKNDFIIYLKANIEKVPNYSNLQPVDLKMAFEARISHICGSYNNIQVLPSLNGLAEDDFKTFNTEILDDCVAWIRNNYSFVVDKDIMASMLYNVFCKSLPITNTTGLVFLGYGENEIYPRLYNFKFRHIVNGSLAYIEDEKQKSEIGITADTSLRSFAQDEVANTIIYGVHPTVETDFYKAFDFVLGHLVQKVNDMIPQGGQKIEDDVQAILDQYKDQIKKLFVEESNKKAKEEYIKPFIDSFLHLGKLDLADFVESVVKLTEVRKNILVDEKNTVGGPIDVMLITKGDGLVWMKRKHYINPLINTPKDSILEDE